MFSKIISKWTNLSKHNKKLITVFSGVTACLVIAVISVAILINSGEREDEGFLGIAETGYTETRPSQPTGESLLENEYEYPSLAIAPTALGAISIEALNYTEFGISTDTEFLISSETQTLTEEHLKNYLSVRSGEEFTLEEQNDNTFLLSLTEEPEINSIINLVYQPTGYAAASYAFQTADIFRVTATTPRHNTHGIPDNTGIEVTFSKDLEGGIDAFRNAFTIDPPATGTFLQRENTYIFMPTRVLELDTRYTVTISQDLIGAAGDALQENYIFSFTTRWGQSTANTPPFSISGDAYETFLPWDEVFIALNYGQGFSGTDFSVNIYDLHTAENFINFTGTDSGTLFEELNLEVRVFEGDWRSFHYLFLEKTLPEGYYLAEIRSNQRNIDIVAQKFIQISPVSVYSVSVSEESIFWIHDASSGEPAVGARVNVDGETVLTNNEGIAIINTTGNNRAKITIEYADYLPFAYAKPTFGERPLIASERFLSYIYTDRPTYRPNDTIDVFGVVKPLYGHSFRTDDVFTLRIGDMITVPITLDSFNSFAVSIPVTNMFSNANVIFHINDERLMETWVEFLDYTNLSYIISGEMDRLVYQPGDNAQAEISITTFTGRPAEGVVLSTHHSELPSLRTNANGIATGALSMTAREQRMSWHPYWTSFWYTTSGDSQISQGVSLPYILVPRNVMLEHELNGTTMSITTNEISVDKIEAHPSMEQSRWNNIDPDIFRGAPVDIDFEVHVTRHVTTRTVRSQHYDHINRRTVTTYRHNTTREERYRVIPGHTENGRTTVTGLPVSDDPLIRYTMEIHYRDTNGRETMVWVEQSWFNYDDETDSSVKNYNFSIGKANLGIGETTNVSIIEGGTWGWWDDPVTGGTAVRNGRMLAILVRDGIISATSGSPRGVPVTFTEAGISNAILYGAYFDGKYIFPIEHHIYLNYDFSEREIEINLDFDKEIYQPGEEVTVNIKTAPNAQVLISVVDESTIQSRWHNANFLSRLYRSSEIWHWGRYFYQFSSNRQHEFFGGGAEGGGGDGDEDIITFRDFFIDNPVFETVQSNANGNATLTFTLPGQVTSWRVTAIALTEDGFGGDTRENIISSLDFYVDLILTNEYIVGDDIAALVRAYGSSPVDFIFNVLQNDEVIFSDEMKDTQGRVVFNAGKLRAGEYTMQVHAVSGEHRDGVELPFTVVESTLIISHSVTGDISDFNPEDFKKRPLPVRLTFTNANIRPLTNIMFRNANSNSFRTDHIAAAAFADYFFTGEHDVYTVRSKIHASNGGIPELIYEDPNFNYTARFAASFPEYVDRDQIIRYVRGNHEFSGRYPSDLLALAAVGEPVLLQLREMAIDIDTNQTNAALYLAAAFVAIGDDAGAHELLARIDIPERFTSDLHRETANTLLFFINTTINPEAAWEYVRRGQENQFISDTPERINFVRHVRLLGGTVSEFQYFLDGETHTARLENFQRRHLHLSSEQFSALNLTPISGDTNYRLQFYGYDSSNWDDEDNRISITRTINPDGDLFLVTLNVTLPPDVCCGSFVIYDRLPSNMRYMPMRRRTGNNAPFFFVRNTQRQLLELNFFLGHNQSRTRTLTYHAMELYEADMAPGITYVTSRSTDNHIWGSTQ
ncbi:MAG: Ig-like domain-containing protein [Defluviitaleaceae bacterium]|nr:Ig-like domain-containing protein [Defluviitaleaceae bacterium]